MKIDVQILFRDVEINGVDNDLSEIENILNEEYEIFGAQIADWLADKASGIKLSLVLVGGGTPRNPQARTLYRDPKWLYQKRVVESLRVSQIANLCNVSRETISRYISKSLPDHVDRSSTPLGEEKQRAEETYRDKEWLRNYYITEGMSTRQIGEFVGVSHATISRWLEIRGIPTRGRGK